MIERARPPPTLTLCAGDHRGRKSSVRCHGVKILTCLSRLLDVELVGEVEKVWVDESEGVGRVLFHAGAGVENEFDPALSVF